MRWLILVLLVLPATHAGAERSPPQGAAGEGGQPQAWAHTTEAVGHLVDGDPVRALHSLTLARAARPLPEIDALAGVVALRGGERAAAMRQLSAAGAGKSTEPLVYYWAGRAAWASGQGKLALRRMEQAISLGGDDPTLRMGHALVLLGLGQADRACASLVAVAARTANLADPSLYPTETEGAIELLGAALRGFPDRSALLRTQGHLLWKAGRFGAAVRRFQEILRRDSQDVDALVMLARGLAAQGQTSEALSAAEGALRLAPGSAQAHAVRGEILLDLGRRDPAIEELTRAADGLPRDGRLLARLGQACAERERLDCARRFLSYAVLRDRSNAEAHLGLALLHHREGERERAWSEYGRAMELAPGNSIIYQSAAQWADQERQRSQARQLLAEAARAARTERAHAARTSFAAREAKAMRVALAELGRAPSCDGACRRALTALPEGPRRLALAHVAVRLGRRAEAEADLGRLAASLRPQRLWGSDPAVIETRGRTARGTSYVLRTVLSVIPSDRFR